MRGSLRSETRATDAALRGQVATAVVTYTDDGSVTPPPSPQSAAMLAAFGLGEDDDLDLQEEEDASANSADSDSDFGSKSQRKSKKRRRLKQRATPSSSSVKARKKRLVQQAASAVAVDDEEEDEKEEEEERDTYTESDGDDDTTKTVADKNFKFTTDKRGRGQQNWVDDGCVATFDKRLSDLEDAIAASVRDSVVTFYNNPPPPSEEEQEAGNELDDGFKDDDDASAEPLQLQEEAKEKELFYSPQDHFVTDSGLRVPTFMYAHLFPHQKQCLEWLHHLHERNTGGILGDEMGLGKTVQIAAFLGAMYDANRVRTVLLLCPASVLLHWVREFHKWYPWLRVLLLHASGTGATRASRSYSELIDEVVHGFSSSSFVEEDDNQFGGGGARRRRGGGGGIVISTYENVRQYQDLFLDLEWDYVVLDEGHRIRNPDAEITLVCKQLRTVHRIILTGTPIQNRLKELWSLFDFCYPGKLGTLPTFEDEFVLPIKTGGYANASKMQVVMAYKCALALKNVIHPFLLRRTKKEVQHVTKMPAKMEQILFCHLTKRQYDAYAAFLSSQEVSAVLKQEIRPFRAISILRHVCNHPDLLSTVGDSYHSRDGGGGSVHSDLGHLAGRPKGTAYGDVSASGKMLVLQKVLQMWKQQGHRVLLFSQTRKMLDILESFMAKEGYTFCRLDGTTSVKERQCLLDAFNDPESPIFIFLLTTRAGGIGVNLTGADRVVVFDPDWNPSTDLQARERSWRLGQTKPVTIYRLITSGTIEEKIYHRQIFKQYLTSKVLQDAKRKRCFAKHTLRDLFVLGDQQKTSRGGGGESGLETTELFVDGEVLDPGTGGGIGGPGEGEAELEDGEESGEMEHDEEQKEDEGGGERGGQEGGGGDNDAILAQLFSGDQLKGVFNHEVVERDGIQNQEADLIEFESDKIAQSALSVLRASCALVRQQQQQQTSLFTPTWTGRSGVAGDPNASSSSSSSSRFGNRVARGRQGSASVVNGNGNGRHGSHGAMANPFAQSTTSSREMLARIKNRKNGLTGAAASSSSSSSRLPGGVMQANEIATQLHAYLLLRCTGASATTREGATSEELLDAFAAVISPKDKLVFRTVLREMATCGRRNKKWVLKDEFKTHPPR